MLTGIKGAIFDLDGVIVDTAQFHFLAWKQLAHKLGFDFTEVDNERLKGVSRTRSLEILLEIGNVTVSEEEKLALATEKNELYVAYIQELRHSDLLPGTKELVEALKHNGVKIALGSASKNALFILDRLGIREWFDVIIDGNSTSAAKPDPEVFLLGCQALGVEARNCVVFEDSAAGVEAAKLANMKVIGIGHIDHLVHADQVVKSLGELLSLRL
ncbi:MAG TPA: beta-phosphoglucomutase [Candidatus Paenibacillus intestinavium]|nr:beta-phosphoglucomutase [Candidatus Paenibacillus intestinavium]